MPRAFWSKLTSGSSIDWTTPAPGRQVKGGVAPARGLDQRVEVADVAAHELGAGPLEVGGIADGEVVVHAHVVAARHQGAHQRRADEAGAAGDERPGHGGEL